MFAKWRINMSETAASPFKMRYQRTVSELQPMSVLDTWHEDPTPARPCERQPKTKNSDFSFPFYLIASGANKEANKCQGEAGTQSQKIFSSFALQKEKKNHLVEESCMLSPTMRHAPSTSICICKLLFTLEPCVCMLSITRVGANCRSQTPRESRGFPFNVQVAQARMSLKNFTYHETTTEKELN